MLRQWRAGDGRTKVRAVLLPLRGRGQGRETARRPCSGMSRGAWEAAKGTGLGAPRVLCSGEVVGRVGGVGRGRIEGARGALALMRWIDGGSGWLDGFGPGRMRLVIGSVGKTRRRPGEALVGSLVIPRGTRESGGGEEDP